MGPPFSIKKKRGKGPPLPASTIRDEPNHPLQLTPIIPLRRHPNLRDYYHRYNMQMSFLSKSFLLRVTTIVINLYGTSWRREDRRERIVSYEDFFYESMS